MSVKNEYRKTCLVKTTVVEWCSKFKGGRDFTQDESLSGRLSTPSTDNKKRAVDNVIRTGSCVSICALSKDFTLSVS